MTRDHLEALGLALIALGAGLYSLPAGLIVGGVLLALWANYAGPLRSHPTVTEEDRHADVA